MGNTTLKQWQKLPTRLLSDLCKKNGKSMNKGLPIYRLMNNNAGNAGGGRDANGGRYRYRLIIPDTSKKGSSEHDIVVTPSLSVSNEEQAKEEAALLGLLYLFPKLPHERTLPEPYRATFLAALKNNNDASTTKESDVGKEGGKAKGGTNAKLSSSNGAKPAAASTVKSGGATANTQLSANLPTFKSNKFKKNISASASNTGPLLTRAQINEARKQHQREVQARIRKHEAIRNANKPVEVFMSARFRRRIECLLAGDAFEEEKDFLDDDLEDSLEDDEDVVRSYVQSRLVHEGFAVSHVIKAYRETTKGNSDTDDEQMDKAYEDALQYLCIHLKEEQLPIGFDPRGGTLDVVRPTAGKKSEPNKPVGENGGAKGNMGQREGAQKYDANTLQFGDYFGLTPKEAFAVHKTLFKSSPPDESDEMATKRAFWKTLVDSTTLDLNQTCFANEAIKSVSDEDRERNEEAAANECEALEAIFEAGEFAIKKDGGFTSVAIALPYGNSKLSLEMHYTNGSYPDLLPMTFVTSGKWNGGPATRPKNYSFGGSLHLKLVQYMSEMTPGVEAIFELFGHVQSLLQEQEEEESPASVSELLSHLKLDDGEKKGESKKSVNETPAAQTKTNNQAKKNNPNKTAGMIPKKPSSKTLRRPRQRSTFWNTRPSQTPPAESYPKLSSMMERARKSLPAAKARDDFLSLMASANSGGRVMLVTGETGKPDYSVYPPPICSQ